MDGGLQARVVPDGLEPRGAGPGDLVGGYIGNLAETVASVVFPTGMTVGPDGAFYVSEQGFGFPAGAGRVLRITLH
jgi:hypothetical protein